MDIEVMQRYVTAFRRKISEGDKHVRYLTPQEKRAYSALREQTLYRYRLPYFSFQNVEALIADIDRAYQRLLPFWDAGRLSAQSQPRKELVHG